MYGNFVSQQKRPYEFDQPQWGAPSDGGHVSRMDAGADRKRKKRSRWGAEETLDKTVIPGMPTVIPANLSKDQERQYILHLQIEEISRRLRTGDLGIPPNQEDRSPSPEPIYNNEGKRLNTREYRTRKKLEEERHKLVTEAMGLNTEYKPPADYKPPVIRVNDKVMIPQEEHPDINFVGLLIGPRGNTLKTLEKETGAKIIIRGKGSVKDGKIGRKDGQPLPGEDEPLHAYVTANNPENVRKAVEKIKAIIKESVEVPEGQNDLRKQQLRELALLNGTLRENDGLMKLKQLQQAQSIVTNTIICTNCGGTGHLGKDCKQLRPGDTFRNMMHQDHSGPGMGGHQPDKAKMDSEYLSLMAELGEGPPPPKQDNMMPQQRMHHHHHHHHQVHHQPQQQQNRFHQPPPNPMGGFNNFAGGGMNRPPPMMSNNVSRPPMSQPQMANNNHNNQPRQLFQQQPQQQHNTMQQQGMQGGNLGMQPSNPMQPQQLQPNIQRPQQQQQQQPGSMPYQTLQQQQPPQNTIPQPVAPPNTMTSQFQPTMPTNMQPQMTTMAPTGVGPVPPPNTQFSSMAAPVPPPQWSNTQAMSQINTNATQSQAPAMGVHPPSLVTAPPPPPPNQPTTTGSNMPWLQGAVPPPPPSTQPAWQGQPPPPPVSMSQMPWQQQVPPTQAVTQSNIVPPPPPPSSGQGFNMAPPPSGGFDPNQMSGMSQLLVAPPPPPPN